MEYKELKEKYEGVELTPDEYVEFYEKYAGDEEGKYNFHEYVSELAEKENCDEVVAYNIRTIQYNIIEVDVIMEIDEI